MKKERLARHTCKSHGSLKDTDGRRSSNATTTTSGTPNIIRWCIVLLWSSICFPLISQLVPLLRIMTLKLLIRKKSPFLPLVLTNYVLPEGGKQQFSNDEWMMLFFRMKTNKGLRNIVVLGHNVKYCSHFVQLPMLKLHFRLSWHLSSKQFITYYVAH